MIAAPNPAGPRVCLDGFGCIQAEFVPDCDGTSCCSQFCDVDEADPCPDGLECMPWFEDGEAPPGQEHIGVCGISA